MTEKIFCSHEVKFYFCWILSK